MIKRFLFLFLSLKAFGEESPSLLSCGGGWYAAGKHHSGHVAQVEYKFGATYFKYFRPQITFIAPELHSFFAGAGIAFEIYVTDRIVLSPNFCPGLYYQGAGRNLGFPIEFRSCFELAYEFRNNLRLGTQYYHISNASLAKRNPGSNAITCFLAFPI